MDIQMEDAGKMPPSGDGSTSAEAPSIPTLDGWIDNLMNCKQLAEDDVRKLCDKVSTCYYIRLGRKTG